MGRLFKNFFSKKQIIHPVPDRLDPEADPTELLYISDLDGTLLNSASSLPQERMDSLNRMIDAGLNFTIATARNYDSVYPILQGLNFKLPVILFNGVYLTDFYTGKNVLLANFVPRGIINHMLQLVHPLGIDPFLYTYGENHHLYYRKVGNPGAQAYLDSLKGDDRLTQVEDFDLPDSEQISGFLLIDSKKVLAPVYRALKKKYPNDLSIYFAEDVSKPGYYWLQSYHRDANKGQMVRILSDHINFPLNRMVVFGDYLNDLEMFNIAGKAIAMENALPEVKAAAHQIIGNNDQGAVVQYLESLGFIP